MLARNTKTILLLGVLLLVLLAPTYAGSQGGSLKVSKVDVTTLVQVAIKAYDTDLEFLNKFQSALSGVTGEAGEGLYEDLFSDPIVMLESVLRIDPDNVRAHLYLGKSFHSKAYKGEGVWNNEMISKAKEQFSIVMSLSEKTRIDKRVLGEAQSKLREVERLLKEGF